jgi:hypothetical protein
MITLELPDYRLVSRGTHPLVFHALSSRMLEKLAAETHKSPGDRPRAAGSERLQAEARTHKFLPDDNLIRNERPSHESEVTPDPR